MYTLRSGVLDVVRLGGYTRCAEAGSLIERGEQESLEHRWCKLLHKDRSTAGCGNTLFSYPAMDLHDKRENMLIPKPHNTPFSCLTISIFCGAERFRTRRFAPLSTQRPLTMRGFCITQILCALTGSNRRPAGCKPAALPAELKARALQRYASCNQ